MPAEGSVTHWIAELKAGDESALAKLHERYWPFLVRLARRKLKGAPRRAADEQDVAQEAFIGCYKNLRNGQFPLLTNRGDFLALMTIITARKAARQIGHERCVKRGGGRVRGESALDALAGSSQLRRGIEHVQGNGRTPAEEELLHETYEQAMARLPDKLRPFAELHLAGLTHKEIAEKLDCAERTVERKMQLIFEYWRPLADDDLDK
jgi:RNA polymerase sigma factor (sigma-70 family)